MRCVPQVHGATLTRSCTPRACSDQTSATDNPRLPDGAVADPDAIATAGGYVSGRQLPRQPVALAMDFAKLAIAELVHQ